MATPKERLQKSSLVDLILDRLRSDILEGRYEPGSALPPERELASRYGVNRTSVKHALMKLESVGLIDIRHGIGSMVLDYAESGGAQLFEHLLWGSDMVDRAFLADALEVRVDVGGAIAWRAATRADGAAVANLEKVLGQLTDAEGNAAAIQALDMEFWRALSQATGNRAFKLILNSLSVAYPRDNKFSSAFADGAAVHRRLASVLAAVSAGDADAAREAAEAHLTTSGELILESLTEGEG
ncbi:MAG: FadR family transcriptional regulator [Deltaproteobacteria bacterium]|nr:FadR family transcriptional regulator [Deltaproteobacteria bacterium]